MSEQAGFVLWFCGLPGSGKSTISRAVAKILYERHGIQTFQVSMDDLRKKIFPNPTYSDEERDAAYRAFVLIARYLSSSSKNVMLDGTGHKLVWRDLARQECPDFAEVYVKCPIELCIERETKRENHAARRKLYLDALQRLKTGEKIQGLGKVPGVDEPFEQSPHPEIIIDSTSGNTEDLAQEVVKELHKVRPRIFSKK